MPKNSDNLRIAQKNKSDEFYTLEKDIAEEVKYYKDFLNNKIVYLPCDGYNSAFVSFFRKNFTTLNLKSLYYSYHDIFNSANDYHVKYEGEKELVTRGEADFRISTLSKTFLNDCDVVITNPPFSLLKEFIPWILNANKKMLVIGNMNAACNRNIFPYIKDKLLWKSPRNRAWNFKYSTTYVNYSAGSNADLINIGGIVWFTNIEGVNPPVMNLTHNYDITYYPILDNYDAINVNKTADIPKDYDGKIAVPVSFFLRYNKEQFDIVDILPLPVLNKKNLYNRLIIRKR